LTIPAAAPSSTYHASDGAAYERFLGRWSRRLADLFVDFARLPGEEAVLDVGCGTGSVAFALAGGAASRRVVGVDIAAAYVDYARLRHDAERIEFEIGDACRLPYAAGTFGGAVAQLVLNFVPDHRTAVREMMRVTRQGGAVAAAVWDFRGGLVYQRLFWDSAAGIDPAASAARNRLFAGALALPDGLPDLWQACGLRKVERESLTIRMDYADFEDYWGPLLGGQGPVGTYVNGLAPARRAALRELVSAAYRCGAPDGPRSMTATAWAVRGIVP